MHGKVSAIAHTGTDILAGLPSPFRATRYHSLIVERDTLPETLVPTAWTDDGLIMAMHHSTLPVYGVQFHPESIASEHGHTILANFLALARGTEHARSRPPRPRRLSDVRQPETGPSLDWPPAKPCRPTRPRPRSTSSCPARRRPLRSAPC